MLFKITIRFENAVSILNEQIVKQSFTVYLTISTMIFELRRSHVEHVYNFDIAVLIKEVVNILSQLDS